jgi:hypothetical protein
MSVKRLFLEMALNYLNGNCYKAVFSLVISLTPTSRVYRTPLMHISKLPDHTRQESVYNCINYVRTKLSTTEKLLSSGFV